MSMHIQQARPPHVVYERRAEEDRTASIEQGRYVSRDVDYAIVTPAGSKDRVERVVADWFLMLAGEVKAERWPQAWLDQLRAGYDSWTRGQTPPESGTPLSTWPALSPAQVKNWAQIGLRTIEELAEANEEALSAYGMGSRDMKARAILFLENAGDSSALVAKLRAAEELITSMQVRMESLEVQLKASAKASEKPAAAALNPTPAPAATQKL